MRRRLSSQKQVPLWKGNRHGRQNLAPELQEKIKSCKTTEELLNLAKEEGYELTDAELEDVAGGSWTCDEYNPVCSPHYGDPH